MGRSCWRHVQLPRGGLAGWGQELPGQKQGLLNASQLHNVTREVNQPLAFLLLLPATGGSIAAGRIVVNPSTVAGAPAVDSGEKVGWCYAWREQIFCLEGN